MANSDLPEFLQKYVTNFPKASSGVSIQQKQNIEELRKLPIQDTDSPRLICLKCFPDISFESMLKEEVFKCCWYSYIEHSSQWKNHVRERYERSRRVCEEESASGSPEAD
jgi:hypothetical protein